MWHPDTVFYMDRDGVEPLTPPRFLLWNLPADLREKFLEHSEIWPWGESWIDAVLATGVDTLEWRQPLCHIEGDLVSDDVFGAMVEVFGDQVRSQRSIYVSWGSSRKLYHEVEWPVGWPFLIDEPGRTESRRLGLVVRDQCVPALPGDGHLPGLIHAVEGPVELAFPSWMDRDDRVLNFNHSVMTEGLVDKWRATEISQHLQQDNSEHDMWFVETAGGYHSHLHDVSFRWVDAPVPEWVERLSSDAPVFADALRSGARTT
jgi:hypothetical protein